jgi:type I restriction enzyme S subunit
LEKNSDLPKDWALSCLGLITKNHDGRRIPINATLRKSMNGKYPYYGASGIIDYVHKPIFKGQFLLIGEDGANLLARSTPIAFIANGEFWVNNHAHVLTTLGEISLEFVSYFINSINLSSWVTGTAQPKLNQANMNKIPIPIPPLNEQKRIVEKIEVLFSKINFLTESINKTKQQLIRYRQSILNSAFEGELTSNWRKNNPNVKSAFELIEEIQNNRIQQFELELDKKKQNKLKKNLKISVLGQNPQIKSWINVKLENLVYIAGRIGWRGLKADEYTLDGPLFLSAYNLHDGGIVDFNQVNHISNDRYKESSEIQLQNNDILLIKDGAGIGRISIVKNLVQPATVNSSLLVIRSNEAFVPEFLFYFLYGPKLQNIAKQRITGSAIPHLFQRDIKKFQLSLPPIEEQNEIVKTIQNALTNIIKIDENLSNELSELRGLKSSILKQAFEGKLVPQDPNDEPAEILLKRIKQDTKI